jgi:hypothetical protein
MPIEDVSKTKTFCSFFLEIMKKTNKNLWKMNKNG